jgi:hypothetical protein
VFAVDLTKGTVKVKSVDNPFGLAKVEGLRAFDKVAPKPQLSELQTLSLKTFKESQATKPFEITIPKKTKTISTFKFEEPTTPKGYKTISQGGLLSLVKDDIKANTPKQRMEEPTVFKILGPKELTEIALERKRLEEARFVNVPLELRETFNIGAGESRFATDMKPNRFGVFEDKPRFENQLGLTRFDNMFKDTREVVKKKNEIIFDRPSILIKDTSRNVFDNRIKTGLKYGAIFAPKLNTRTSTQQKLDTNILSLSATALNTESQTKLKNKQKNLLALNTSLALKQENLLRNKQESRSKFKEENRFKFMIPIKERDSNIVRKEKLYQSKGGGFDVQIKRHGKLQSLGLSLTRAQAGILAQNKLKQSLGATAFVKASGRAAKKTNFAAIGKANEFRQYNIRKGQRLYNPNMYIQENKFRLGTKQEKQEIQSAKLAAAVSPSRKKKTGGFWGF